MSVTHQLVLDTVPATFAIDEGTEDQMIKLHKKWRQKVFYGKSKTISIPNPDDLPADVRPEAVIGIRVVRIPEEELLRRRAMTDPRARMFLEKTGQFEEGIDLLDKGMK